MGSMWTGTLGELETEVLSGGSISAEDVLKLRRSVYGDGEIEQAEADFLFHLNQRSDANDPAWDEFYVEALTDYFVWKRGPNGALNDDDARQLIDRIGGDHLIEHPTELKLLSNILYRAQSVPQSLCVFAFKAVRDSVLSDNPKVIGAGRQPGVIDASDVQMIQRIIYGMGSDGGIAIDREEAELLFDLNNRSAKAANDPSWTTLFVKAITMYVLYKGDSPNRIDREEAAWLIAHIEEDGQHDAAEKDLLAYLKREAEFIHSDLDPLMAKFGIV